MLKAPQWITSVYSKFPLVTLEQEDDLRWRREARNDNVDSSLWIVPPGDDRHAHYRSWASSSPTSLRAQLLFLLRGARVQMRPWKNESAAPGGGLPALHLAGENRLLGSEEVRGWLDQHHPIEKLQGLPNQEAFDKALAIAKVVLGQILPAYLASTRPEKLHLLLPHPPALAAGLSTPLPAAFTGDVRRVDMEEIAARAVEGLEALPLLIGDSDWALGAKNPTPLDALVVSHIYPLYSLPESGYKHAIHSLDDYVERVMEYAGANCT